MARVDRSEIRDGMEVVGRDGVAIGRVQDVESGRIILGQGAARDGTDRRFVQLSHAERVEGDRLYLLDSARVETGGLADRIAEATGDPDPHHPHGPRGKSPLIWIVGGLVLLASLLFVYMRTLDREQETLAAPPQREAGFVSPVGTGGPQLVTLPDGRQLRLDPLGVELQVNNFLAGDQPAPRSFPFDKLQFDTGSAAIRPADRPTVAALGQQLAEAVVAALAARGVSRDRLEAASGGEGGPVAPNATAPGQAANRRTELVVLAK